jgi:hypothetical protein
VKWNLDLNAESAAGNVFQHQMLRCSIELAEASASVRQAEA